MKQGAKDGMDGWMDGQECGEGECVRERERV